MDIWDILGIAATDDEKEIRRAYARQLKIYRPDTHPQEYQNLREAFESAKRYAKYAADSDDFDDEESRTGYPEEDEAAESGFQPDDAIPETIFFNTDVPPPATIPVAEVPYTQGQLDELARHITDADHGWKQEVTDLWMKVTAQGSLHVIQQFHTDLAGTLAQCEGLTESPVEYLSAFLGWRLNEYDSTNIVPAHIQYALNAQLRQSEVSRAWLRCETDARSGKFSHRMALKYLIGQQKKIPLWLCFVPGFVAEITAQFAQITGNYPELEERMNPVARTFISEKPLNYTLSEYYLCLYWGILCLCLGKFVGITAAVVTAGIIIYYLFLHNIIVSKTGHNEKFFSLYIITESLFSSVLTILIIVFGTGFMADIGNMIFRSHERSIEFIIFPVIVVFIILVIKHQIPADCPMLRKPGVVIYMAVVFPARLLKFFSGDTILTVFMLYPAVLYGGLFFAIIQKFTGYLSAYYTAGNSVVI